MPLFDKFFRRQSNETPTDILVGLLVQRIHAQCVGANFADTIYWVSSGRWLWKEQGIYCDFQADRDRAFLFKQLRHVNVTIDVTFDQQQRLLAAVTSVYRNALQQKQVDAKANTELAACDAIASIIGIAEPVDLTPAPPLPPSGGTHKK